MKVVKPLVEEIEGIEVRIPRRNYKVRCEETIQRLSHERW